MHEATFKQPIYEAGNAAHLTKMGMLRTDEARLHNLITAPARDLIRAIEGTPASDERATAIQRVEESVMWAMAGVRKHG
jgi:hypothetical protein